MEVTGRACACSRGAHTLLQWRLTLAVASRGRLLPGLQNYRRFPKRFPRGTHISTICYSVRQRIIFFYLTKYIQHPCYRLDILHPCHDPLSLAAPNSLKKIDNYKLKLLSRVQIATKSILNCTNHNCEQFGIDLISNSSCVWFRASLTFKASVSHQLDSILSPHTYRRSSFFGITADFVLNMPNSSKHFHNYKITIFNVHGSFWWCRAEMSCRICCKGECASIVAYVMFGLTQTCKPQECCALCTNTVSF